MIERYDMVLRRIIILASVILSAAWPWAARAETFSIGDKDFLLNGQPFQIRCGEMHFARIPREYWAQRLRMAHAMGLNTVCAYLFWNLHRTGAGKVRFFRPGRRRGILPARAGRRDCMSFCVPAPIRARNGILAACRGGC